METNKEKIIRWAELEEKKNMWFVILLTRPSIYLNNLIKRTFLMGLFLFVLYKILNGFDIGHNAMPPNFHSIVGIVIGLLLVFRTNTAYDRWWEARKLFASMHSAFIFLRISFVDINTEKDITEKMIIMNNCIFKFLSKENENESIIIRNEFLKHYVFFINYAKEKKLSPAIEKKMIDMLECFCSLERIKNTPIPLSYSLHIKLSIFAYLLILPFSLFFGMGIWAIPLVMVLFFIIAGIEIISNEIENPFKGDPNDLPMEKLKLENEEIIKNYGTR